MDEASVIFVVSGVMWILYLVGLFRSVDLAVDDLHSLFLRDKEKWWLENELPNVVGRSDFVTKLATGILDDRVGLQFKPGHTEKCSEKVLLVRLDNADIGKRKERNAIRTRLLNVPGQIPTYFSHLHSLT